MCLIYHYINSVLPLTGRCLTGQKNVGELSDRLSQNFELSDWSNQVVFGQLEDGSETHHLYSWSSLSPSQSPHLIDNTNPCSAGDI